MRRTACFQIPHQHAIEASRLITDSRWYSKLASEYDQKFQKTVGLLEEEVKSRAEMLGAAPGGRLLDYACGTGLLSRVRYILFA